MILYANGCSYTNGVELFTEAFPLDDVDPKLINASFESLRYSGFHEFADFNETHCFPMLLGELLGADRVINNSVSGSSNENIAYKTIADVSGLLKTHKASDITVVIGWSSIDRRLYSVMPYIKNTIPFSEYANDREEKRYRQFYERNANSEILHSILHHFQYVHEVTLFLENKGVRYLMFEALPSLYYGANITKMQNEFEKYPHLINSFKYIYPNNIFYSTGIKKPTSISEFMDAQLTSCWDSVVTSKKFSRCINGHPGLDAHRDWAQSAL